VNEKRKLLCEKVVNMEASGGAGKKVIFKM